MNWVRKYHEAQVRFSMVKVNEKEIETHLKKWQGILRLRDWDILVKIVKTKWRKSGDIKIDLDDKKAVLLVNQTPKCEKLEELEELVVHELLHLKLYGMDQMIEELLSLVYGKRDNPKRDFAETQFMTLLESTVEDLTKGYLASIGNQNTLSFGRLKKSIDEELVNR
jgi:hypothetical protein